MAVSERISYFRRKRGMTQKELGETLGFGEKTAVSRLSQYETDIRKPKKKMVDDIANVMGVSRQALNVPDIDTYNGLMHTLFAIEDIYGLTIDKINDQLCLSLDREKGATYLCMFDKLNEWQKEAEKMKCGEITKAAYDEWRYNYPEAVIIRTKETLDARRAKLRAEENSETEGEK